MVCVIFLIGLCFGSFVNVLVDRLIRNEDIFILPSHCDYCGKKLGIRNLVPFFSWVIQKGKSDCCKKKLSWQYPLVELMAGFGFAAIFHYNFQESFSSLVVVRIIFLSLIFVLGLAAFVQDAKFQAIHQSLLTGLLIVTLIEKLVFFNWQIFKMSLFSLLACALPFFLLYKISREKWLGEGDVWLAAWVGLFLGYQRCISAIYFAFLLGGAVSILALILQFKKMRDRISLGPFLFIGVIMSFFITVF